MDFYKKIGIIVLIFMLVCVYMLIYSMPSFASTTLSPIVTFVGICRYGSFIESDSQYTYVYDVSNYSEVTVNLVTYTFVTGTNDLITGYHEVNYAYSTTFSVYGNYFHDSGRYTIDCSDFDYLLLSGASVPNSHVFVEHSAMYSQLSSLAFTQTSLWIMFEFAIPYVLVVTLIAFGFYVIRKMCKVGKGKSAL